MAIITLTTDYGNKDYSVSSLKAKLISEINDINKVSNDVNSKKHQSNKIKEIKQLFNDQKYVEAKQCVLHRDIHTCVVY